MKHILRCRQHATTIFNRVITDGMNTSLWFNPWINHKSLVDILGWHRVLMFNTDKLVSQIALHNQFNPDLLLETKEIKHYITSIPINIHQAADYWEVNGKANFNFVAVWNQLRDKCSAVDGIA